MTSLPEKIDPAQLARLGSLPIKARVIVEGALSGMHRARVHGASVEFAEHKEYSPGDELRHVDWKAYAKQDRIYVKQFEQESQLTTYLVLDASASMRFVGNGHGVGSPANPGIGPRVSKLEYAGLCLAAMAYLVIQQQDKVGLLACGDRKIETLVPPRARTNHLHDLLGVLEGVMAKGGVGDESPAEALTKIAELSRRKKSLVIIASDLFDADDKTLSALALLRAQRHDVSVLHVLDPDELTFPYDGLTLFESLENDHKMLVNPNAIKKEYQARMDEFLARCKGAMSAAGIDYHLVPTDHGLERTLLEILVARSRLGPSRRAG